VRGKEEGRLKKVYLRKLEERVLRVELIQAIRISCQVIS
jgi:hypothetical protein